MNAIKAIYERGQLRLLTPIDLDEGQMIELVILPGQRDIEAALGDLVALPPQATFPEIDESALLREIDAALVDQPPLSQSIIDERSEGQDCLI